MKVWVLAEATTGYILSFQVYAGTVLPATSLEEHASVELVQELLKRGTYSTETIRPNRKNFPEDLKVDKNVLEIRNFRFAAFSDLTAVLWRDRWDAFVLSSMHNRSVEAVMKRPQGGRDKIAIPCLTAICDSHFSKSHGQAAIINQTVSTRKFSRQWA